MMNHNGHQTLTNLRNFPDIVGQKVSHKTFGDGTITSIAGTTLFVQFKEKTTKFQFPDAIGVWLTLNDSDKAAEVADFIRKIRRLAKSNLPKPLPSRIMIAFLEELPKVGLIRKKPREIMQPSN